ncbi:MAG: ABC transporter ATP-binding protein [SAR324 cluster bacterium]|nr:ABC transporter ATP-binding protein [SAR324 cluster bacterium]
MSLHLENLDLYLSSGKLPIQVLDKISFSLEDGQTLGIVGESGCGKSMTALAIMQLITSPPLLKMEGKVLWNNVNLLDLTKREMRKIRSKEIAMIFQEPMTALNPVMRVGDQIREVLREHNPGNRKSENKKIIDLLDKVGIPSPEQRAQNYPHQLSGGMRQRIMIAMALACGPRLLIADEPSTALDVTIQAQILEQLRELCREFKMGLLFISHDLDVVGYLADRILVMYAGEIVEWASTKELFASPAHPYTRALQRSRPKKNQKNKLTPIAGNVPPLDQLPQGCRFYDRCELREDQCAMQRPPVFKINEHHQVRCFLFAET